MRYKTQFRLFVKAVGLLLGALGLPSFLSQVLWISDIIVGSKAPTVGIWQNFGIGAVSSVAQMGLALYLFFGGRWIVNLAIPSNRPYCPECAYDLTGAVEPRCPECGTPFRWEDVRPKMEDRLSKSEEGTRQP